VSARDLDSAWKTDGTAMQSHDVMTQSTAAQAAKPGQGKDARLGFRVNPGHRDAWQEKDGEAGKSLA
jgi:hypothetical protein